MKHREKIRRVCERAGRVVGGAGKGEWEKQRSAFGRLTQRCSRAHVEDRASLVREEGNIVEGRDDLAVHLGVASVLERVERTDFACA